MKNLPPGKQQKLIILAFFMLAAGAVFLLAGGLPGIELERGEYLVPERTALPSPEGAAEPQTPREETLLDADLVSTLLRVLFWILIPFAIYVFIFENDRFLKRIVGTLSGLIGILFLAKAIADMDLEAFFPASTPVPTQPAGTVIAPPPTGSPSTSITFIIAFTLVFATLIGAYLVFRLLRSRLSPEEKIIQQAREALNDLSQGAEIENTILRCYHQMSQTLSEEKGINRDQAMTPREFERRLVRAGFSEEPVSTLTRLFEKVRYGDHQVSPRDEKAAVRSLEQIIGEDIHR